MTHDEFIAFFAHELRGPVGAIGSAAQVLRASEPGSSMSKEASEIVERQSRRLASVVDDLQLLRRLISPHAGVRREPVNLVQLLRAHCDCEAEPGMDALSIATDRGHIEIAIARTAAEAPSRMRARIEPAKEKAAALFTLEPVGGGFGIQFLRALLEIGGAQVALEPSAAQGRRLTAHLAR